MTRSRPWTRRCVGQCDVMDHVCVGQCDVMDHVIVCAWGSVM